MTILAASGAAIACLIAINPDSLWTSIEIAFAPTLPMFYALSLLTTLNARVGFRQRLEQASLDPQCKIDALPPALPILPQPLETAARRKSEGVLPVFWPKRDRQWTGVGAAPQAKEIAFEVVCERGYDEYDGDKRRPAMSRESSTWKAVDESPLAPSPR